MLQYGRDVNEFLHKYFQTNNKKQLNADFQKWVQTEKIKYTKSENYISFNRQTENNIKDLKERIICTYDKKVGVITISVKMPDPVVAANVARFSMNYLTDYIINYRTEKQKRDLDF